MSAWHVVMLPAMCGWGAMLEADAVLVGQWMFSRPLVLGPLLGLLCGNIAVGLSMGILCELFCLEVLPVGCVMPINGSVAAGIAVLLAAGPDVVPIAVAFPAALGLGAGHRACESRIRQWRGAMGLRALKSVEEEGRVDWEGLLVSSIGAQVAMTGVFVYASVAVLGPLLAWLWGVAPFFLRDGLSFALRAAPAIGLVAAGHTLFRKK